MKKLTIIIILLLLPLAIAGETGQELATSYPNQILKADIDSDDVAETIRLTSAGVDDEDIYKQAYIVEVVENGDYISSLAALIDRWQLTYLFTVEIYPTLPPYIAVGYTKQGEIPYSIDLFRYKNKLLRNDGNLERIAHFESDIGSILLKDVDGDDVKELVVGKTNGDVTYKYIDDDKWEVLPK